MKLNRLQLTIAGFLIALALALGIYFGKRGALHPASATSAGKSSSFRQLVAQPVKIQASPQMASSLPPGCLELWVRLTANSLEHYKNLTDDEKNALNNCSAAAPILAKHDAKNIEQLRTSCAKSDIEGSDAMQRNCALYFYLYKGGLIAYFNQDKPTAELGTAELALLILHEHNHLDPRRFNTLSDLVDELVARGPSYESRKLKASIQIFQLMQNTNAGKAEAFVRTLQGLQIEQPDDEQLHELQFVALTVMNDQVRMNEVTEKFNKDHPSSAAGYYIRSAYFWQQQNREKSIELLKNAIALDPANPRYMETRDKVESAPLGSNGLYDINANFDFDLIGE